MPHKEYKPAPIDTSHVQVPRELMELSEYLAKNIHEIWASQRISQGWTWGEKLDSDQKLHPDLLPYEELTETEKAYDRNTSMETIKIILSLGYKITKA
ncbi:MAG: Ryanodine receptor Ryr [Clostridia bacterium]|nr:Ryanodine receptor Ryr [Clostridia bacterium]